MLAADAANALPQALVLTPTRELAAQVHQHLESLGRHAGISSTTVFGGVKPAAGGGKTQKKVTLDLPAGFYAAVENAMDRA